MKNLFASFFLLVIYFSPVIAQTADVPVDAKAQTVADEKNKITGSFEMNYLRHYIWRGAEFGNNDVAQPELELNYKDFTISICQNLNYVPKNVPQEYYTKNAFFDEQDAEIRYSKTWGKFSSQFSAMAYFYFYQIGSPNTAELYNWTGFNFYKDFSFFTENSVDIASYSGAVYSNNGILFEHSTKKNLTIEWSAYAGFGNSKFNTNYFNTTAGGLNLIGSHIDITKEFGKFFCKITGEKNSYTKPAIKEATSIKGTDNFGVAAGINF